MSCTKADAFLAKRGLTASLVVDAKTTRFEGPAALKALHGMNQLVVSRGAKSSNFSLKGRERPADADLVALLCGPSGNLRAPTLKVGGALLVGFNAAAWEEALTND